MGQPSGANRENFSALRRNESFWRVHLSGNFMEASSKYNVYIHTFVHEQGSKHEFGFPVWRAIDSPVEWSMSVGGRVVEEWSEMWFCRCCTVGRKSPCLQITTVVGRYRCPRSIWGRNDMPRSWASIQGKPPRRWLFSGGCFSRSGLNWKRKTNFFIAK